MRSPATDVLSATDYSHKIQTIKYISSTIYFMYVVHTYSSMSETVNGIHF